jgi:hypothetical protein
MLQVCRAFSRGSDIGHDSNLIDRQKRFPQRHHEVICISNQSDFKARLDVAIAAARRGDVQYRLSYLLADDGAL